MYANPQRAEYEALVGRVRDYFGSGVPIGGYTHNDLLRLRRLDAQREAEQAKAKAAQPLNDARAQLHQEHRRAVAAWQKVEEGQKRILEHKRAHQILGFDLALLELVSIPEIIKADADTVDAFDAATAEMSRVATEIESKARKINSAAAQWEQYTPDQQNRALILTIADRLGV